MPIALIIQIIEALAALAPQLPEAVTLVQQGISILNAGSVTPEQEAAARAALDAVRAKVDAA